MAIYELSKSAITPLSETTFSTQGWRERDDLQRLLRDNIDVISPDTLIIAEEFSEWDESSRRIDLLGVDKQGNLVVIELKRTQDGGHMDLQAIRYAAMVSTMKFERAVQVFEDFLRAHKKADDARQTLLDFLGLAEPNPEHFAQDVRIVLASAEFSKELTTAVHWLNERDLDIRCVRLKPYVDGGRTLLDIQQVLPLPEVADYIISVREKSAEVRESRRVTEKWKGDYFVNLGMDGDEVPRDKNGKPHTRHWDFCREYGYVSAGGGERFERFIKRLQPGDPIYAYIKDSVGYVGFGHVTQAAVPIDQFRLEDGMLLVDRIGAGPVNAGRPADRIEFAAAVKWAKTFPIKEAKRYGGIFAPIATVCPIRDPATLKYLQEQFGPG